MNAKIKQIALPFAVIIAVLLAFSSPATADYSGDHPLTTYEHAYLKDGGLIYETVTDGSGYTLLNAIESDTYSQPITINIPEGATVKRARLYNYYAWSKSDFGNKEMPGLPAEAVLTFNGATVTCQNPTPITNPIDYGNGVVQYWDTKGQGYSSTTYDFPSGTFAWDVTDLVTGSGTYTATITNADSTPTLSEYFNTWGFGLLVVYEDAEEIDNKLEYWIDEGCDYLLAREGFETPETATTCAPFDGITRWGNPEHTWDKQDSELTTVVMGPDKGDPDDWGASMNMNYFNGLTSYDRIGPSTIDPSVPEGYEAKAIGLNYYDVTQYLIHKDNIAYFQDRNDCEVVSNAFLVAEKVKHHK
jgi:hypothetical protein